MRRIVLDTNVLVSALLFGGSLEPLVSGWKSGSFTLLFSRDTFAEFRKVLNYPRFALTTPEINALIAEDILPYCEVVDTGDIPEDIYGVCRDPGDEIFLACAVAAGAAAIVSGDKDLFSLASFRNIPILSLGDFRLILGT